MNDLALMTEADAIEAEANEMMQRHEREYAALCLRQRAEVQALCRRLRQLIATSPH